MRIQLVTFRCDSNPHHIWQGKFYPEANEGVGILEGSWRCPTCNDLGQIIINQDISDKDFSYILPLPIELLKDKSVKQLFELIDNHIYDLLRLQFGGITTLRKYDLMPKEDYPLYKQELLEKVWQIQDALKIIKSLINIQEAING